MRFSKGDVNLIVFIAVFFIVALLVDYVVSLITGNEPWPFL